MIARRSRYNWPAIFVSAVHLSGWLAVNALITAGIMAMIAFAIGSFSLPLTMAQLANLANRYVAANAARQSQFNHIVLSGFLEGLLFVSVLRRGGIARILEIADHV